MWFYGDLLDLTGPILIVIYNCNYSSHFIVPEIMRNGQIYWDFEGTEPLCLVLETIIDLWCDLWSSLLRMRTRIITTHLFFFFFFVLFVLLIQGRCEALVVYYGWWEDHYYFCFHRDLRTHPKMVNCWCVISFDTSCQSRAFWQVMRLWCDWCYVLLWTKAFARVSLTSIMEYTDLPCCFVVARPLE